MQIEELRAIRFGCASEGQMAMMQAPDHTTLTADEATTIAPSPAYDACWPRVSDVAPSLRGAMVLSAFVAGTVPLMPVQAVLKRVGSRAAARAFPHWYHRQVCRLLGLRLHVEGRVARDRPVLLVANHTSWLDIPVISAVAPVSFVAKREVGSWPGVSVLANLQRTVYVDRERRSAVGQTAGAIAERLAGGDTIVLFAEGTSTDGNRVLPFRSSLFAAAMAHHQAHKRGGTGAAATGDTGPAPAVQTLSIVYARRHGVPLGWSDRARIGWYGDMDLPPHAWDVLKSGPIDVAIRVGTPVPMECFADRKAIAAETEREVRASATAMLRDLRAASGVGQ